jgi:isocitrate dehydrogenase kinase/phosphatase
MPGLAEELLRDASESCRIEGDDLIVEHCYIERRLRPLNLFLREAEPAAAEAAIIDYGNALRDLAASNVFPGDLLLKNFGVTSHRRVIFYDYDEISLVTDCVFRDLPQPTCEEEETSAEPWFHCGPQRRLPGTVAAVPLDPTRAAGGFPAASCRTIDGGMVAIPARAQRLACLPDAFGRRGSARGLSVRPA